MQNRATGIARAAALLVRVVTPSLVLFMCLLAPAAPIDAQSRTLDIYFIDVEGGGATLVVSPSGESLLIDSGFRRPDDRDARRIHAVTQKAGLKKIDHHMVTHFHADHVGGLNALVKMIPILRFYGHGGQAANRDVCEELPERQ